VADTLIGRTLSRHVSLRQLYDRKADALEGRILRGDGRSSGQKGAAVHRLAAGPPEVTEGRQRVWLGGAGPKSTLAVTALRNPSCGQAGSGSPREPFNRNSLSPTCMRACAREAMADHHDAYSGGASCQCRQVSPLSPERFSDSRYLGCCRSARGRSASRRGNGRSGLCYPTSCIYVVLS
jgi:hypothetical protein